MVLAGVVMSRYSASVGTRLYSAAAPGLHEYSADIMMESESVPAESNSGTESESESAPAESDLVRRSQSWSRHRRSRTRHAVDEGASEI
jgi:hypothetical protein